MLYKPLVFAATAAAILIVPETSEADDSIFRALPIDVGTFEVPSNAFSQVINVPCTQCRGHNPQLELNFAVEKHRLMLNGFELYPQADPWNGDLSAAVIKGNGKSDMRRLGYGLAIRPEGVDEDQHLEVVSVEVRIIEVGDRFVDGVPLVNVKLIKAPVGELIIGGIDVEGHSDDGKTGEHCNSVWCSAKGLAHDTWKGVKGKFKGCHRMKGHGHKNHSGHGKMKNKGASGHPHGHHNDLVHDNSDNSWATMLKDILAYIVIPVLMGVTAGVGVALVAMFACTLVFRIFLFFKGEQAEPALGAAYKAHVLETIAEDEKSGLIVGEEAGPRN
ncbi:hypothetical protein FZEAL_7784 [Fusarium zealandicum]|uniref:DUF7728 domain-containing protein n=1 Tax=Fusarium zealandicum TaxID=1053134 RepID=A0A8H4UFW8_9HYPO|nr:hypothetical protein FZEAL_7784 [Fusarium zealandicum]